MMSNDFLTLLSRLVLGGVFIYASFYKIIEPASFAKSIWYYHLVAGSLINLMALLLPWAELLTGICLIIGWRYRGAVLFVTGMLVMFLIALVSAIARNLSIDCGCFKASGDATRSAQQALWMDIGLLILALQLWASRSRRWMIDPAKAFR